MGKQKRDKFKEQIKRIEGIDQEWPQKKLSDADRVLAQQLVDYLQHAKHWEPVAKPTKEELKKAKAQDPTSEIPVYQFNADFFLQKINKNVSLTDPKTTVNFWALHTYLKEVVDSWQGNLAPLSVFPVLGLSYTGATVGFCISAFTEAGINLVFIVFGALAVAGIVGSIIGINPFASELCKTTPNAIPAIKTRRHLHRFFKDHPKAVEDYYPGRSVLRKIAHSSTKREKHLNTEHF